jgi:hypothetical protein
LLSTTHQRRAIALTRLGRHAEAAKDFAQAGELQAREIFYHLPHAVYLARWGEHTLAVAEANAASEAKDVLAVTLYKAACVYALASLCVKEDPKLAERYASRAVELLRQLVAKGYKSVAYMKKDTDLDGLRGRDDFKKLMAQLEQPPQEERKRGPGQGTPDGQ